MRHIRLQSCAARATHLSRICRMYSLKVSHGILELSSAVASGHQELKRILSGTCCKIDLYERMRPIEQILYKTQVSMQNLSGAMMDPSNSNSEQLDADHARAAAELQIIANQGQRLRQRAVAAPGPNDKLNSSNLFRHRFQI